MIKPKDYTTLSTRERKKLREQYIEEQGGLCHHCGTKLIGSPDKDVAKMVINKNLFPPNFFAHPVHLHHDHRSGLTIGAVHSKCNAVLWQYHGE